MRYARLALLFQVFFISAHGQSFVQAYPPFPVHDWLSMVHWGGDTIFACGTNSGFSRSTDAGLTWTPVQAWNAGYEYTSMGRFRDEIILLPSATLKTKDEFLDTAQCFLLGYRPSNGGMRRIVYPLLVPQPFRGVYKTDLTVCTDGIVVIQESEYTDTTVFRMIRSADGGAAWREMAYPDSTDVSSSAPERKALFRTVDTGFVVAGPWPSDFLRLYFTSTGGRTWTKIPDIEVGYASRDCGNWLPGKWVDAGHFVVLCRDNILRMTTDNGSTWSSMSLVPVVITSFSMYPDGTGVVTGSIREIYVTDDWGATWVCANPDEYLAIGVSSVSLAIGSGAFVVGTSEGTIVTSHDGGLTLDYPYRSDEYFTGFTFCDAATGFATIFNSRISNYSLFSTADAGRTWNPVMDMREIYYADVFPVNGQNLWAVRGSGHGNDTVVYRSIDGGKSWTGSYINTADSAMNVVMTDNNFSFSADSLMLSTSQGILRTTDGGATWEILPAILLLCDGSSTRGQATVRRLDQSTPFEKGDNGRTVTMTPFKKYLGAQWIMRPKKLARSTDYGRTWESMLSIDDSAHSDYSFTALNATSDSVIFARTTHTYPVPTGEYESVFHTTSDGGRSWATYTINDDITAYNTRVLENIFSDGTGYVVEGEYSNRLLRYSRAVVKLLDGGRSLQRVWSIHRPGRSGLYNTFQFVDALNGWFSINTFLFHTTNGGIDWIESPAPVVSTLTIDRLSPNPACAGATVTIAYSQRASTGTPVTVEVFDILGRRVFNSLDRPDGNARRFVHWNTAGISTGVYLVLVRSGASQAAGKLVIR